MDNAKGLLKGLLLKNPIVLVVGGSFVLFLGFFLLIIISLSAASTKGFESGDKSKGAATVCLYNFEEKEFYSQLEKIGITEKSSKKIVDKLIEEQGDPSLIFAVLRYQGKELNETNSVELAKNIKQNYYDKNIYDVTTIVNDLAPEVEVESASDDENEATITTMVKDNDFIVGVNNYFHELGKSLYCDSSENGLTQFETVIIGDGLFSKPLEKGMYITSNFGYRFHPITNTYHLHRGVDLGCTLGDNILSVLPGVVHTAKYHNSWGNYVLVDHQNGIYTLYAHMSVLSVNNGTSVVGGQVVGKCGSTGDSTNPHLHLEVQLNAPYGDLTDPMTYFKF